ncbi:MAG: extracellular solute-binding protein, partial [Actinomycetales bacterium]|nr:extracellular solute-binding protein [Actinomycetales bacterium]
MKLAAMKLSALFVGAAMVLSACGTATPSSSSATSLSKLGKGEGTLSLLGWPGYAEDGSNDPKVDWVTPFEKATGCQVTFKSYGTSDEALNLFKTGNYDAIAASGDATLRLIASGQVQPLNTKLIPSYKNVYSFLKNRDWNTVDGQTYGVPHGYGANLLMYKKDVVKPAPTSWSVVFDGSSAYKGHVTAYDSPIYIADAAVYLMAHKPELGIKDPYALDDKQLAAAVDLLKAQRANISEYWSDYLKEISAFESGDSVVGTTWQVIVNSMSAKANVGSVLPSEGATGWSDSWMVSSNTKHVNCAYKWLDYID